MPDTMLRALADQYLDALAARQPARLVLAPRFRFTENGAELPLGDGLWKTMRAVRTRRLFVGRSGGQALILAVVEDERGLALLAARLGWTGDALLELETLVTHQGESSIFTAESLLALEPVEACVLEPAGRAERAALVCAVDAYFEGIERDSSVGVSFHPACQRIENGVQMTSNPAVLGGLGVAEQFDYKVFAYIERVRARRYPLVDVETGQVLAIVFLDVPGTVSSIELGGRRIELPPHIRKPRSTLLFELSSVERGRIRAIEAFMHNRPFGASAGW